MEVIMEDSAKRRKELEIMRAKVKRDHARGTYERIMTAFTHDSASEQDVADAALAVKLAEIECELVQLD
jgi:hypothetical protein